MISESKKEGYEKVMDDTSSNLNFCVWALSISTSFLVRIRIQ